MIGLIAWGFITPNGVHAAVANNIWSTKFVRYYFGMLSDFPQLITPPKTHLHANQLIIKHALSKGDYDLAITLITPILDDSNSSLMENYAEVLYFKGDFIGAINVWERLAQESSLRHAVLYFQEIKRNDLVLSAYQSLYQINPEKYTSPLAIEYRKQQKPLEDATFLFRSVQNFPDSDQQSTWLRLIGDFYRDSAEWDEAESYYYKALKKNPDDWVIWQSLGEMYYAHNSDLEKAIDCSKKIIEITPERGRGYYLIGYYLQRSNAVTEALHWFKIAAEKEPNNKNYQVSYTNTLRDTNQLTEAIELYEVLILQYPEDSELLYEVSWAYWLNNEIEVSKQSIEKAIQINPGKVYYYLRAGDLYEKTGNIVKAKEIYETALTIDPANIQASQKLNQINNP